MSARAASSTRSVGLGLVLTLGCCSTPPAPHAPPPSDSTDTAAPSADAPVQWLRDYAIPIRTLDPADEDFSDLEPLVDRLSDARVVILGEQSHGDGTTFSAKVRLVSFLHQRLGFSVLAFESDMFACTKAWARIEAGDDPHRAATQCVFSIWSRSEQVAPLWRYLARHARSDRPLRLWGIDSQFYAQGSQDSLLSDMRAFFDDHPATALTEQQWATWATALELEFDRERRPTREQYEAALDVLHALERGMGARPTDGPELAFWRQMLTSITAGYAGEARYKPLEQLAVPGWTHYRDVQMADNVRWLAEERFERDKIIVWAATYHAIRNPGTVGSDKHGPGEREVEPITMGDVLARTLTPRPVVVGFVAYSGTAGQVDSDPWWIPPAPEGSLEDLCHRAGLRDAIIDLRQPDPTWLSERRWARPMGYGRNTAVWPEVMDFIVYTEHMQPSRTLDPPEG